MSSFKVTVKGTEIEFQSAFATLAAAWHALNQSAPADEFAQSLLAAARRRQLTPKQVAWIHKLATDRCSQLPTGPQSSTELTGLAPIVELLARSKASGRQFPSLQFEVDGRRTKIALCGAGSRTPGHARLVLGYRGRSDYLGTISPEGDLRVARGSELKPALRELLVALAANPAHALGQHGIAVGRCCMCGRELTDARSRTVGYGPICAEHHGLPWGDRDAADAADAASREVPQ